MPSLLRLKAKYPQESWDVLDASIFWPTWLAYTRSWEAVLAEWDAGELGTLRPCGQTRWPFAGLRRLNDWSITRGEARQRELVGMTAEVELPEIAFGDRVQSKGQDQS
eukprot:SAG31_NODE_4834_length_2918_cov_1.628946_2_plen_108_part_00